MRENERPESIASASTSQPPSALVAAAPSAVERRALRGIVSILGTKGVKGPWTLPPHLRVATILGNAEIDLREARFESDTVIEVLCVMGNVTITVPPDVVVECDGEQFLGSFEARVRKDARNDVAPPAAPTLRVVGKAYAGNAHVIVRRRESLPSSRTKERSD